SLFWVLMACESHAGSRTPSRTRHNSPQRPLGGLAPVGRRQRAPCLPWPIRSFREHCKSHNPSSGAKQDAGGVWGAPCRREPTVTKEKADQPCALSVRSTDRVTIARLCEPQNHAR